MISSGGHLLVDNGVDVGDIDGVGVEVTLSKLEGIVGWKSLLQRSLLSQHLYTIALWLPVLWTIPLHTPLELLLASPSLISDSVKHPKSKSCLFVSI